MNGRRRHFNIEGPCDPQRHYMIDLSSRLERMKSLIDDGRYFTLHRGRQYGKTTILHALGRFLAEEYLVVSVDFELFDDGDFESPGNFIQAFADAVDKYLDDPELRMELERMKRNSRRLRDLFAVLNRWCAKTAKPILLVIDEVDSASNYSVFINFLSQLRGYYIAEDEITFYSVILAGVKDIRNLKQKLRPEEEHRNNSPWNIASDLDVDMNFSVGDIMSMLGDYEPNTDWGEIAQLIYDYTAGYPVLVSRICKLIDEGDEDWSRTGISKAVRQITDDGGALLESLVDKLENDRKLYELLYRILFRGEAVAFNKLNSSIGSAFMYGFVKNMDGRVAVANRIFETVLYDWYLSGEREEIDSEGASDRNLFIRDGVLDMEKVLERFIFSFNEIYGSQPDRFKEEDGRRLFLLYLKPIINGAGNYYIEAQTRDYRRTDLIVDYSGKRYIVELKLWRGEEYNRRGEQQLFEYLDYFHEERGYLLSFCFNRDKKVGTRTVQREGKTVFEAVC